MISHQNGGLNYINHCFFSPASSIAIGYISRIESGRYAVTIDTLAVIDNAPEMEVKLVDKY